MGGEGSKKLRDRKVFQNTDLIQFENCKITNAFGVRGIVFRNSKNPRKKQKPHKAQKIKYFIFKIPTFRNTVIYIHEN